LIVSEWYISFFPIQMNNSGEYSAQRYLDAVSLGAVVLPCFKEVAALPNGVDQSAPAAGDGEHGPHRFGIVSVSY
jgi:hypothetical protein